MGPSERGVNSSCAASPSPPLLHAAGMNLVRAMIAPLRLALATAMPVLTCLSVHCTGNINERGVHPLLDDHRVHASSPVETTGGDEFVHVLVGAPPLQVPTGSPRCASCRSTHGRRIGCMARACPPLLKTQCHVWLWQWPWLWPCPVSVFTAWPPSAPQAASVRMCPAAQSCLASVTHPSCSGGAPEHRPIPSVMASRPKGRQGPLI